LEADEVWVSHASVWELTIKLAVSRLELPEAPDVMAVNARFRLLPIALAHIRTTARLPHHHHDPFDRILVAQAIEEGLTLVTADVRIQRYPVAWLW
jgi:PIN domain nuclease of toxin-antitoxin system